MGKLRRQRKKFHLEAKAVSGDNAKAADFQGARTASETAHLPLQHSQGNIFEGLQIDIGTLKKSLTDSDVQSVKSFKSVKSELGNNLSKKDKLKIRREMFLKKFEVMSQIKKEKKLSEKRKSTPVVGDMNPLFDALPSLESLLTSKTNKLRKETGQPKKLKAIEKASKQKKNQLQGIKIYQQILKNKQYQKDPHLAISEHVKAMLDDEKS